MKMSDHGPAAGQRAAVAKGNPLSQAVPLGVRDVLRSSGEPLQASTRALMERRFQHDFGGVRVHTDNRAARSASELSAEAYTVGRQIVFAPGRYQPGTREGRGLLAHELAHTVQQRNARLAEPSRIVAEGGPEEHQADLLARAAARGDAPPVIAGTDAAVMRATRTFSLTFDDGPHSARLGTGSNRTERVLDTLRNKGIQAGFFIQTAAVDAEGHAMRGSTSVGRALVARMQSEGHVVGVHTGGTRGHELHASAQAAGRLATELTAASSYISSETGSAPHWVRPPTGRTNPAVLATYRAVGLENLLWDIDGDEGRNLGLPALSQRVTAGIQDVMARTPAWRGTTPVAPKIVVLYHDIQAGSSDNLGTLIDFIRSETTRLTGGADSAAFATP
jgi:peptidoglycan/xylan/chitin deacetylase (PgdA/CDA1 family)